MRVLNLQNTLEYKFCLFITYFVPCPWYVRGNIQSTLISCRHFVKYWGCRHFPALYVFINCIPQNVCGAHLMQSSLNDRLSGFYYSKVTLPICNHLKAFWRPPPSLLSATDSRATVTLVLPGHESWENSHANFRLQTLINSHLKFCHFFTYLKMSIILGWRFGHCCTLKLFSDRCRSWKWDHEVR